MVWVLSCHIDDASYFKVPPPDPTRPLGYSRANSMMHRTLMSRPPDRGARPFEPRPPPEPPAREGPACRTRRPR